MARGLPVVASDIPAHRAMLTEAGADPAAPPAQRIARLAVEASLAGPLGPWRPLGEMAFDPATGALGAAESAPLLAGAAPAGATATGRGMVPG